VLLLLMLIWLMAHNPGQRGGNRHGKANKLTDYTEMQPFCSALRVTVSCLTWGQVKL
jgi:hypothetical protein